jgi:hypothetical protein
MLIRKLDKNTFDVFGDVGFDSWTRLRRYHWGMKQIAGVFLPRPVLQLVSVAIATHPQGSIENV